MMTTYSTYDAKARFSEVIRRVRDGETLTISYRGEPVAEIRPFEKKKQTLEDRLAEMERKGTLIRSKGPRRPWQPVFASEPRPGAVERFLADRND